jgi:hypothetical protein
MKIRTMALLLMVGLPMPLQAQLNANIIGRIGQPVELGYVYWINVSSGCVDNFKRISDIILTTDQTNISFNWKPLPSVRTSQCGNMVPGAMIVARISNPKKGEPMNIGYTVKYEAKDGFSNGVSNHTRTVTLQ